MRDGKMRKSDKLILMIYIVIGAVLLAAGLTTEMDYYSTLMFAMGVALLVNSIGQFIRYYYHTRPENIEAYRDKVRKQSIDLKDERKIHLRRYAGYLTWAATMILCFLGSFLAALLRADTILICILAGTAVMEYLAATNVYKYLCRKM